MESHIQFLVQYSPRDIVPICISRIVVFHLRIFHFLLIFASSMNHLQFVHLPQCISVPHPNPPWITLISSDQTVAATSARLRNETRSNPMPLTTTELKKLLQQLGRRFFPKASPMVGFSFSLLCHGGSDTDATTWWTDGKPWEIAWAAVGRERGRSVDIVDGWEAVGK